MKEEGAPTTGLGPAVTALVLGIASWLLASIATGRREPWDAAAYWTLVYPLSLLAAGWLGWRWPDRPARWALALFAGQFVGMWLRNGEIGNLSPLGLVLFGVLALPAVLLSRWAARRRRAAR
jgi:hypothetical protein